MMKWSILFLLTVLMILGTAVGAAAAGHEHGLTYVQEKEPGVVREGNIAYYYCAQCGKYFDSEDAEHELSREEVFFTQPCHADNGSAVGELNSFSTEVLMNLSDSMQGAAICEDTLFLATNQGQITVYDIETGQKLGTFWLASGTPDLEKSDPYANHANQMMFGAEKWDDSDPYPLLYVSTGNTGDYYDTDGSYIAKCAVERIVVTENADGTRSFSSQLVQTIAYADKDYVQMDETRYEDSVETFTGMYKDGKFIYESSDSWTNAENYQKIGWGWPASFVDSDPTDTTSGKFYLFSARFRTTEKWEGLNLEIYAGGDSGIRYGAFNYYDHNAYIITEFDMPPLPETEAEFGQTVTLTPVDITDQFETEFDTYFTQGGTLYQGRIYYAYGNGGTYGSATANGIRVFDIESERIISRLDLSEDRTGLGAKEPECCCIYKGKLALAASMKNSTEPHAVHVFGYLELDMPDGTTQCSECGAQLKGTQADAQEPSAPAEDTGSATETTTGENTEDEEDEYGFDPFFLLMGLGDIVVVGGLLWGMKRNKSQ